MKQRGALLHVKRALDVTLAGAAVVATAPILAAASLAVRASIGSPVLFRQERPGRGGRPFYVFKLRTMTNAIGHDGTLLSDAERLTKLGRFLRATSIDELPQLINVLRGDMSLVGPRPLLMHYLSHYDAHQARRHDVLPGVTGWAQIHGRNVTTWTERFNLDVWYVDNWTPLLDARILFATVGRVLRRDGVSPRDHATMPAFVPCQSVAAATEASVRR